jgi:catechol 2,3-dioxygenase-like lactoylglutathione lyase family enzyme
MLHHVSIGVRDVASAAPFYDRVLGTLGYRRVLEVMPYGIGYGDRAPAFWVQLPHDQSPASVGNGVHVGFIATSKAAIEEFHRAALAAGGSDAGAPGPRPDYGPDYFGAFVRDPDGNKLEAVLLVSPPARAPQRAARVSRGASGSKKRATKTAGRGKAKRAKKKAAKKGRKSKKTRVR